MSLGLPELESERPTIVRRVTQGMILRWSQVACSALMVAGFTPLACADYASTVLSQSPVGYWRLDETTPPSAVPAATNLGSLGPIGNGGYQGNQGMFRGFLGALASSDTAVHFDGLSQNLAVPYAAALSPAANFSVEAWLAADVNSGQCALACGHFATPRSGWLLYQGGSHGWNFRMYNQNAGTASLDLTATNSTVNVGTYSHVVITYNGSSVTMYLNGVPVTNSVPTSYVPGTDGPFTVGVRSDNSFRWAGKADEVAFYASALSAADVAAHYAAATTNAAGYPTQILGKAPLLYFRLDEAGNSATTNLGSLGATANGDYASGTHPGVAGPRPSPFPGFGSANNAVAFDGTSSSCVTVPPLNLNTNTVTMSGWINAMGAQAVAAGLVLCRGGTTAAGLSIDAVGGGLGLGYNWNNDVAVTNWRPSITAGLPTLPDSGWAYFALVVQPSQAAIYLVDGTNYAHFAGATNSVTHVNQAFDGFTRFGADFGFPQSRYFRGALDEIAIFNRALSVGELYSQYASACGGVPPKIFSNPQAPINPLSSGDTLSLFVDAGGTPSLRYQWRKNTSAISGATNSSYSRSNLITSDAGSYDCVITNGFGTLTSGPAVINVNPPTVPTITVPPVGRVLYPSGTLALSVSAAGGGLSYQWQKGASPIPGATDFAYLVPNVTTNDTGAYSVSVTNTAGRTLGGPVSVTVLVPTNAYEQAIVADAPEAWYRLNETSGTTMRDSMGRHAGTYTNTDNGTPVAFGAAGAVAGSSDTAVTFNGASHSFGGVPFSPSLNSRTFTLECWAKTTDLTTPMCPVSSRSSVPQGCWLYTYPAGVWSGEVGARGLDNLAPSTVSAATIVANEWKHVVILYDTTLKIYLNGQWDGVSYADFERNTSAPLIVGALGGQSTLNPMVVADLFNGQIDEVLVYTNGLSLAQIRNHYSLAKFRAQIPPFFVSLPASQEVVSNPAVSVTISAAADGPIPITYQWYKDGAAISGATTTALNLSSTYSNVGSYVLRASNSNGNTNSPTALLTVVPPNPPFVNVTNSLVLHLKFDGDYSDSSGRGNNGTSVGTPGIVPGRLGNALFFSTSNSIPSLNYVTLGRPTDLNFSTNVNFSVAYWVKYDAGQINGDLPFLCSAVNSYGNPGFTFAPSYKLGGWSYSLNGAVQDFGGVNTINDGNWHHLIHTFDRTGSAITYLDGIQVDSRSCTAAGNLDTDNTINVGQDPTGLYIEDGSTRLDDLAVWRRALTQYEAYAIHYAATNSNASFDTPGNVILKIAPSGSNVQISWQPGSTLGTLLQAPTLNGPWTPVGAYVPAYTVTPTNSNQFFRLQMIE